MTALTRRLGTIFTDPNPILVKELRATFRTNLFVRFLYLSTALIALLVLVVGALAASEDVPPATVGHVLFQVYMGASLLVICLVAPGYASAAITSEHEQQTWESLELSGMSAARIVVGKLAASYASIALVLVAVTPVVGIAFLFGGVSPGQVVVGFASLLVALAPAVAFGIAVSARLRSTRVAIVLSTISFFPLAIFGVTMMVALGDEARIAWGVAMEGPFFYTEAFVTRVDRLDTWIVLLGVPLYAFGMPVWFLLASAIAAVRPAAEDRARPMKIWAVSMTLTTLPIVIASLQLPTGGSYPGDRETTVLLFVAVLLVVYGLLFVGEPALPPRSYQIRYATFPAWRRALAVLGPGAPGGMRFSILASLVTIVAVTSLALGSMHFSGVASWRVGWACIVLTIGAFCTAALAASLGGYLRVVLGNALAARVLTLAFLTAAAVLPFLIALLVSADLETTDGGVPAPLMVSLVYPILLANQLVRERPVEVASVLVPAITYGSLALIFAVLLELRVARIRREAAERAARFRAAVAPSTTPSAEGAP